MSITIRFERAELPAGALAAYHQNRAGDVTFTVPTTVPAEWVDALNAAAPPAPAPSLQRRAG